MKKYVSLILLSWAACVLAHPTGPDEITRTPGLRPVLYIPWQPATTACTFTPLWDQNPAHKSFEFVELTWSENFDSMPELDDGTGTGNRWASYLDGSSSGPVAAGQVHKFYGYTSEAKRRQPDAHEQQLYVDPYFNGGGLNPFSIYDSYLSITASRTPSNQIAQAWGFPIISGLLSTRQIYAQKYGYFEISAKVPAGNGLLPAFWMLPVDHSVSDEIDIFEAPGSQPGQISTTLHYNGHRQSSNCPKFNAPNFSEGFHLYGVLWMPDRTIFYYDRMAIAQMLTPATMNKPFYMMMNLAVGGAWPGFVRPEDQLDKSLIVDYVAAYSFRDTRRCVKRVDGEGVTICESPTP